jgi:hypothetical protein
MRRSIIGAMRTPRRWPTDDKQGRRRAPRASAFARSGCPILIAALALAPAARAQSSSDQAAAEALFKQGRDLMASGQYAEACPKLAESERLDPAPGTLLNLATCYERNGQVASAWVTFKEAATAARKADQTERARLATEKAAALEPSLPTLTIVVPPASDVPDLEVRRDGEVVGRAEWGAPIPLDPGPHAIEARAAGRLPWQGQAPALGVGTKASVEVPPLAMLPEGQGAPIPATAPATPARTALPAAMDTTPAEPVHSGRTQRAIGWVTGGVGLAGVAVGAVFGAIAMSDNNQASNGCISNVCTQQGFSSTHDAKNAATASTVAFAVGGGLVAVGLVLWLTAPADAHASGVRAALVPMASEGAAGTMIRGSF